MPVKSAISGSNFKPYTDGYKQKKSDSGRKISPPDLTWSGRMLNNMTGVFVGPGKSAVVFTKTEEANKAAGNMHKRNFFEITESNEISKLIEVALELVKKALKRTGLT